MKQQTLAMAADQGAGFERFRRRTKREDFLDAMDAIVPWVALCAVIEPHYPKAGNGRRPIGLQRMLRIHLLQHWFNLADNAVEEALYDIASLRRFVGIDLGLERVPDETTVLKFRHLLEQHGLGEKLFAEVGRVLQTSGFALKTGTNVDATLIGAPSSTKNAQKARDPEMHQIRKGQQWYFGMKLHIGVDSHSALVHSAVVQKAKNRNKSRIRARVENVFAVVKRLWGFDKVRDQGLAKNATRAFVTLAMANIYLARQPLLAQIRA